MICSSANLLFLMIRLLVTDSHFNCGSLAGARHIADRIFIFEYESLGRNPLTQVTHFPSYQKRVDKLLGVQTGGPGRRGRKPGASRVVLEYLDQRVNLREALHQPGLFAEDDPRVSATIREMIRNGIPQGSYVLEVEEPLRALQALTQAIFEDRRTEIGRPVTNLGRRKGYRSDRLDRSA